MLLKSREMPGTRRREATGADAGFSLVIVLGLIGALAIAAAAFVQVVRSHTRTAAAGVTTAALEALADGGVQLAILDLVASRNNRTRRRRFPVDGAMSQCSPGSGTALAIYVQDEAGKVDLNMASDEMIRALVRGVGIERADAVTDAILDFKDIDDDRRVNGAEAAEYAAAGRAMGPKNAPFQSWEELGQVLGMPPSGPALLRPYVTLYSSQATLDTSVAAPGLVGILARGQSLGEFGTLASIRASASLPPEFVGASAGRAFTVRVEARNGNAAFAREAVIEMTASGARPYIVRRWMRAPDLRTDPATPLEPLPPC